MQNSRFSQTQLSGIFSAMSEGVLAQDVAGRIIYANAAAEGLLGLSHAELFGLTSLDPRWSAVREDGSPLPGSEHPSMRTLASGQPLRNQIVGVALPSGERRWLSVNSMPIVNDRSGKLEAVVTTFVDIGEQRRAQQALHDSEEQLYFALRGSGLGIWDRDVASGRVRSNDGWRTILGYDEEGLIRAAADWEERIHPEDRPAVLAAMQAHLQGKTASYETEHRLRHRDGSWVWIHDRAMVSARDATGVAQRIVGTYYPISGRKEAEAALARSEQKYRTVLETTGEAFWMTDGVGRILEVNDAYCRLTGYSRAELLGMTAAQLDVAESPEGVGAAIARVRQSGSVRFEAVHRKKDGSTVPLEVCLGYTPLLGDRVFAIFHDQSGDYALRAELQRLYEDAVESRRQADEARSLLVRVSEQTLREVGQELHDDVGQILSGSAMLAASMVASLTRDQRPEAKSAAQLAQLLNEAVGKLRALSHGLFPIALQDGELVDMVELLVKQVEATKSITVRFAVDADDLALDPDVSLQTYRIVQEATANAVRHSGAGQLEVSIVRRGDNLRVSVCDDGIGIEHDRRKGGLLGVGMGTMRSRAALIGGDLSVFAPAGGGTCVELKLDLSGARS